MLETVIHTPEFLSLSLVLCSHISLSAGSKGEWFHPGGVCARGYAELSHLELLPGGT